MIRPQPQAAPSVLAGDGVDAPGLDGIERVVSPVVEAIAHHSEAQRLELASGRRVTAVASPDGDRLTVTSPDGELELAITLTPEGPVLRMRAAALELAAAGTVAVDCDRFEVRARGGIEHRTGGDLDEVVAGHRRSVVRQSAETRARSARIEAARGDVELVANDDVRVLGERIKLNC